MLVKRYGSGPRAFFCLHGWSGDHRTYEPLEPWIPADASLYAADLPGCGASPPPRAWTMEAVAGVIGAAIDAIPARSVTIVGNCMGALLALRAPVLKPVERYVLIDALAYWPWYFRVFAARGWGRYAYFATFANPLGRRLTNASLRGRRAAGTDLTAGFASAHHDAALLYLELLREIRSPAEFAGLDVPVDIVFGERTFGAVRESARRWRAQWPRAHVFELAGAGHLPLREAPEGLAAILFGDTKCNPPSPFSSTPTRA